MKLIKECKCITVRAIGCVSFVVTTVCLVLVPFVRQYEREQGINRDGVKNFLHVNILINRPALIGVQCGVKSCPLRSSWGCLSVAV